MARAVVVLAICSVLGVVVARSGPGREEEEGEPVSYSGYSLLRVTLASEAHRTVLLALVRDSEDVRLWATHNGTTEADVLCAPQVLQLVKEVLHANSIPYTVAIPDLQEAILHANPTIEPEDEDWENRSGHRLTWRRFHRYKGIHAREWISPATVTYLLLKLVEFREEHPSLLDTLDWYFLPVLNPDGYEYSHTTDRLWRKSRSKLKSDACVGVDLNRNFDFHWMETGSSSNPCHEIYAGTGPFSEPESRAVGEFILRHRADIKVYLTFHSYGQMWLVPYGYTQTKPADYYDMYVLAEHAVEALEQVHNTDYLLGTSDELLDYVSSGGSDDWAKGVAGVKYAYTVELPDIGHHGFVLPASKIEPTGQEAWQGVKALAQHYVTVTAPKTL